MLGHSFAKAKELNRSNKIKPFTAFLSVNFGKEKAPHKDVRQFILFNFEKKLI